MRLRELKFLIGLRRGPTWRQPTGWWDGIGAAVLAMVLFGADAASFDAVVSPDGSGSHKTVQEAIAAAPANGEKWFTIQIKPGVYQGQFIIPRTKPFIRLVGSGTEATVLTWPYNVNDRQIESKPRFDPGMYVFADDFQAENLTFENTSGDHGQALALRVDGDRALFKDCRIRGWQDTLMVNNGRQYFTNCFIEGRVDFIYGSATALFDRCIIHSKNGGYITASSAPMEKEFGFVFLNCKLTGDPSPWVDPTGKIAPKSSRNPKTYFGRPWRPYANVALINCDLGDHIRPEGWHNWDKPTNETTARYSEYNSSGPGANPTARVKWARQLTDEQARGFTLVRILGGSDNWKPNAMN